MYLSRLELDMKNRKVLQAMTSLSIFHGAVESSFEGSRKRNLWRIDQLNGRYYLLILSGEKPDLTGAVKQFAPAGQTAVTKSYEPLLERVKDGTSWHFRLCANPTYSISQGDGIRGRICAHTTVRNQREWLVKQAEKHGFRLNGFDVVESKWQHFHKGEAKYSVSMLAVTYEGDLVVTDKGKFKKLLTEGVGREKAYGVGLMTLVGRG